MTPTFDAHTALIVVDVQNDFAHPSGSLYVDGGETVIPYVNELVTAAQDAGALIVYTQDWHPPSTPHFENEGGVWPVHCVADTWGAEFHSGLDVFGPTVRKGSGGEDGYSGFTVRDPETGAEHSTGLESTLRKQEINHLFVVGLATDYCVKSTVIDGCAAGFRVTVLADGIRGVNLNPGDAVRAAAEMVAVGAEIS